MAKQFSGHVFSSAIIEFMECRSIKWSRVFALGFLLLACPGRSGATFGVFAESRPGLTSQDQPMNFTLEGKITKVETGKFTVSSEGNIIFHVRYDDKTEIKYQDGGAGSSKDFRVGVQVKVEGDLTESGEIVAGKIEIQQEAESKPPTSRSRIATPAFRPASTAPTLALNIEYSNPSHDRW